MPPQLSRGLVLLALCSLDALAESARSNHKLPQQEKFVGDSRLGKLQAEENRCSECHGIDGNGQSNLAGSLGVFPKLAGQNPDYLWKQFKEFRSDQRHSDIMSIMARSVDDADAQNILIYYSSLPKMNGKPSAQAISSIEKLFSLGDTKRGIAPCVSCHGTNGKGLAEQPTVPIIGGQDKAYLQKQLQDWRSGERKNSPAGVMNITTKALTEDEIIGLADYLSGL
ncbi:MAG TPA: c-type cytochrome [Cellvibrionaceae bacterium]